MTQLSTQKVTSVVEGILRKRANVLDPEQIEIAVQEALDGNDPPDFSEVKGERFDWITVITLTYSTVAFVKDCVELYGIYQREQARRSALAKATKAALPNEVANEVCDAFEDGRLP